MSAVLKAQPKLRLPARLAFDIIREPVSWLWRPWIQRRALNLLTGEPGVGKSTLTCEIIAALSAGRALPGDAPQPPINCWILNSEDAAGDTIKPRLEAQGADMNRVWVTDVGTALDPPAIKEMRAMILANKIELVTIDPLQGWMGGAVDMHRANETREWAGHIRNLAVEMNLAVMFIRHRRKGADGATNINAGMGSIDITGFARSEIGAGKDKNDQKYITKIKGNVGRPPLPLSYTISNSENESDDTGVFTWGDVYEPCEHKMSKRPRKLTMTMEWLRDQLACGSKPISELLEHAAKRGIASGTLRRASRELKVVHVNKMWQLPEDGQRSNADGQRAA